MENKMPEWDELTPEQQAKIQKVVRGLFIRTVPVICLKVAALVLITTTFITALDAAYVNSTAFRLISAALTGFFLIPRLLKPSLIRLHDRLDLEVKAIVNNK